MEHRDDAVPHLSSDELAKLVGDSPNLSSWGDSLLCPFRVVKLRKHSVVWLNRRWLRDCGLDDSDVDLLRRVCQWMQEEFGYVVDDSSLSDEHVDRSQSRTFYADRYGSNNGLVAHGGSGRAAAVGAFHIKGIGVTPLVGKGVNREHSHGSASLNVAVREAIYAEVCDEEFPHGAVPTIAIIDAGCTYDSSATPPRKLRRAILVRPAMVRISHMQRAAGFIDPVDGHKSSQLVDVQRVREVVDHFIGLEHRPNADERLRAHFEKIAEQIAFGQVHRIYNGGFFSSNLTIEAELLDFGNMHILPNWVNAKVLDSDLGFGREMLTLEATIRSLQFHFDKYAGPNAFDANAALLSARSAHSKGFQREICRIAGQGAIDQHSADIEIVEALTEYFNVQQCISHSYTHAGSSAHGWLSLPLGSENTTPTNTQSIAHESKIVGAISRRYKAGTLTKAEARQTYANLNRFLRPRSAIFRDHIQTNVDKLIGDAPTSLVDSISAFVQSTISQGRRHWRHLPDNFVVSAHVYRDGHSLLSGMTGDADKKCLWMEGTVNGGNAVLFDNIFPASSITRLGGSVAGTRWTMIVMNELSEKRTFQLGGLTLTAPDFDVYYD